MADFAHECKPTPLPACTLHCSDGQDHRTSLVEPEELAAALALMVQVLALELVELVEQEQEWMIQLAVRHPSSTTDHWSFRRNGLASLESSPSNSYRNRHRRSQNCSARSLVHLSNCRTHSCIHPPPKQNLQQRPSHVVPRDDQ